MATLRRLGPVIASIALVCTTGALGLALTASANTKAEGVLVNDRNTMQRTLAGLGKQYLLFSLKEGLDYASTGTWQLTPGSPADEARLETFVTHATFLDFGAAVVTLAGQPLETYSVGAAVPPPTDPGYGPMVKSLLAAQPDASSVMRAGSVPVVAMGVPIAVAGQTKAIFVGYMRLSPSPLETYVEHLHAGKTGRFYVVDSRGDVVAGTDPSSVGTDLGQPRALAALAEGRSGTYTAGGLEVSYSPYGVAGWSGMTTQSATEFFGPIRSGNLRIGIALLALLAVASAIIIALGYKQEVARRQFQEMLHHQAYHDGLTGLANRSLLNSRLQQAVARSRRQGAGVALLYLDLDGFKPVNDRQGHEVGDALLVSVGDRLLGSVRLEDTVARIGGDEFAILMEDLTDPADARQAAERVVSAIARPFDVLDRSVRVGVSVGVVFNEAGADDGESMLRDADLAMYRAKDAGKSGYVFAGDPAPAARRPVHAVDA
jgi:diguanylate cyclase (GGDEF)-like protein